MRGDESLTMGRESGSRPGRQAQPATWRDGSGEGLGPPDHSPLPVASRLRRPWPPGQAGVTRSIFSHVNKQGFTGVRESGLQT